MLRNKFFVFLLALIVGLLIVVPAACGIVKSYVTPAQAQEQTTPTTANREIITNIAPNVKAYLRAEDDAKAGYQDFMSQLKRDLGKGVATDGKTQDYYGEVKIEYNYKPKSDKSGMLFCSFYVTVWPSPSKPVDQTFSSTTTTIKPQPTKPEEMFATVTDFILQNLAVR